MLNLDINRPELEDIQLIYEFFEIVIKETFEKNGITDLGEMIEKEIDYKKKCLKQDIESEGENRYFLIAKQGNKILGTIEYGPSDELIFSCTNGKLKDVVEIGTVFVHPDYQGKGIGSSMLNQMYIELRKKNIKEFCLDSGYRSAQKIWLHKFGMPEYHLKNYWGKDEDHMIWRVNLPYSEKSYDSQKLYNYQI